MKATRKALKKRNTRWTKWTAEKAAAKAEEMLLNLKREKE